MRTTPTPTGHLKKGGEINLVQTPKVRESIARAAKVANKKQKPEPVVLDWKRPTGQ